MVAPTAPAEKRCANIPSGCSPTSSPERFGRPSGLLSRLSGHDPDPGRRRRHADRPFADAGERRIRIRPSRSCRPPWPTAMAMPAAMPRDGPFRRPDALAGASRRRHRPGPFCSRHAANAGRIPVLEELGRGGMGRVYKALHTKLDRVVAVKVLPRGRVGDRQAITRFEREMKAVGRLAHPNIVQAHDAREIDGTPVLIMEFVDGLDLAEIVRRIGPLPVADGVRTGPPDGRGAAMCPRARAGAPRHQAVEHHAGPIGRGEAAGPRLGPVLCRRRGTASRLARQARR